MATRARDNTAEAEKATPPAAASEEETAPQPKKRKKLTERQEAEAALLENLRKQLQEDKAALQFNKTRLVVKDRTFSFPITDTEMFRVSHTKRPNATRVGWATRVRCAPPRTRLTF